jgi:hypothetical protein
LIYVVFDSAVLVKDYKLRSVHLKVLLEQSRKETLSIAIPRVVFDEVTNKWHEDATAMLTNIQNARTRLGLDPDTINMPELEQLTDLYRRWLRQHLNTHKVRWLDIPDVGHDVLLRCALQKRKPFRENGAGYRDALIWESVKQLARESDSDVIFLAYDKHDFSAKDGELHADLVGDLRDGGLRADQVTLMTDPAAAVDKLVTPAKATREWFASRISHDESYNQRVIAELTKNLDRTMQILEQDLRFGEVVRHIGEVRPIPDSGRVVNAWVIGRSRIWVELEIDAEIEVFLDVADQHSRMSSGVGGLSLSTDDTAVESHTVRGRIIGQLELPEKQSDQINDAYAYIVRVSDRETS